jgi:hypothetical protein
MIFDGLQKKYEYLRKKITVNIVTQNRFERVKISSDIFLIKKRG